MPLYRRLPKFGLQKGHIKTEFNLIKIEMLNECSEGTTVDFESLVEAGTTTKGVSKRKNTTKGRFPISKVLGGGELKVKGLKVQAHAFTESAREEIEKNGGECIIMSPSRTIPLEDAEAEKAASAAEKLVKLKELRALKQKTRAEKEMAEA
jgi:large subunit ribosomal protein L15